GARWCALGLAARRSNDVIRAGLVGLRRRTDLRASRRSRLEALPHWARLSAAHTRIGPRRFRSVCRCYQEMAARCTISWRRPFIALRQSRQASRAAGRLPVDLIRKNSAPPCNRNSLAPITGVQFAENLFYVRLDRSLRQPKLLGNSPIAPPS